MGGIILDLHGWRGFHGYHYDPDLFHFRFTFGFVTIYICKFCVADRLRWLARQVTRPRDVETATRLHGGE